jgi:hypothetical protein
MTHDFQLKRVLFLISARIDSRAAKAHSEIRSMIVRDRRSMGQIIRWRMARIYRAK